MVQLQTISSSRALASLQVQGHDPCRAFLHSSQDAHHRWSRWSYAASPATLEIRCDARTKITTLRSPTGIIKHWVNPIEALNWMAKQMREAPSDGPPFKGGWLGWLSYDLGRLFENITSAANDLAATDDLNLPLFCFTYHGVVVAYDHVDDLAVVSQTSDLFPDSLGYEDVLTRPQWRTERGSLHSNFSRAAYEAAVQKAIDYIAAGDVFQVNLAQRFTGPLPDSPVEIYRRMRNGSPSTFGAYVHMGDHALLCNSPELFLRVSPEEMTSERRIVTRPIKGTRPRLAGMDEELRKSVKDQAELNMIVDLERNDLGRICNIGSIKVTEPRTIERHAGVYHGVATVEGILRDEVTFVDILKATFPGGSITGAPKIRAMQIIDELEPHRRGPYCGAIGFLSVDGHMEFNIAIRTVICENSRLHIPVGGGIVADSVPAQEFEETLVKARPLIHAVGVPLDDVNY